MKCTKCGKRVKSSEKFCTYCGNYVGETNDTTSWEVGADLLEEERILSDEDELEKENEKFQKIELTEEEASKINTPVLIETVEEDKAKEESKEKHHAVKRESKLEDDLLNDKDLNDKEFEPEKISIKDSSGTKKTEYSYKNEDLLEAYIGEDYKIIKKMPINIWAFLLNWMYLLYRKLYITGVVGLVISWIVIKFFRPFIWYYVAGVMILLGFAFNKYYIFISKRKVERIISKAEDDDRFSLANTCKKKGGVNVPNALLIYFSFLVIVFFTFVTITINKSHNTKFYEENSTNQATCRRLIKTAYNNVESENKVGKASDATCKVMKKQQEKEFEIYIKTEKDNKFYYSFYATENGYIKFMNNTLELADLQIKRTNGYISAEEDKKLTELKTTEMNYQDTYNKAKEEDQLIEKKKDKEPKTSFIFTEEEIIQ